MASDKSLSVLTVRLTPERSKKLDFLAGNFGMSKNEYIGALIDAKYDQCSDNPQLMEAIQKLNEIKDMLKL